MKIIKRKAASETPLWVFFKRNLPPTLVCDERSDGYGTIYEIHVKRSLVNPSLKERFANWCSDGIAVVGADSVELRHPEYFSDFEDIIRKYEATGGSCVTFTYWES